jgi:cysteine desulfurase / selenocysteine lyase
MSIAAPAASGAGLDTRAVRARFPALGQEVNGHPLTYLDSAATTQRPDGVIEAVARFYREDNANVHRGLHELSRRATDLFEGARERIARFLGIRDTGELIFTRGTTESVNLVAWSWGTANLREGDEILLTVMEHHSNLVPWQILAQRTRAKLRFIELAPDGTLDLSRLDELLGPRTKLVAMGHVSNALGTINPVAEVTQRAHAVGAVVLVDGAQAVPHAPVDIPALGADFYAFSGHKMYGPTGIGGLWGRRELLEAMPPFHGGGDMIDVVELERSTYAALPSKFEAGTPHIAGVVGLGAAVDFLEQLGMEAIEAHGGGVVAYALERLAELPGITVYGPRNTERRASVVSFTLGDVHPHDLATILDAEGVAIRAGHHCTQPLMRCLGVSSTARASFGVHNDRDDVERLVQALGTAVELFGVRP